VNNETNAEFACKPLRGEWAFAFFVTSLFLLYAGFITFHHEMWRDELQAWLISRDSPSIFAIFQHSRYEGHPLLWFLCLWPLTRLMSNPVVMQWFNLLIVASAVFLIAKTAPAPRWLRTFAALGYFPVYEYGSIARNYGLSILMVIAFCAIFPRRRERPVLLGILILLAANTSLPACLLAMGAVFALSAEAIVRPPELSCRVATWAGLGIAAGGIVLSALQMHPPVDSGFAPGWFFQFNLHKLRNVLYTVTKAYVPLPKPGAGFWQSAIFGLRAWSGISATMLLGLASLALIRRPVALAYYLLGSLGLLAFFYVKYVGYLRHHGFLFICFGTALWLASTIQPVTLPRLFDAAGRWAERAIGVLFTLLLVVHLTAAGIAGAGEYAYVFSAAKATAKLIRDRGLDRFTLVSARDYTATPVISYLKKDRAYYSNGGRFGSYVIWDKTREFEHNIWDDANRLTKSQKSPVVVLIDNDVLRKTPPPLELRPALQLVGCLASKIQRDESYCVFLLETGSVLP